jgi:crotonobetainyl-CoA:carnitine CoA-transferase CaiB-like acyl-CoA transferase
MPPLDSILVVDLSRVLAGPYATMVLGDLGARVLKIESPAGDETRRWGPPFLDGESAYYLSVNRNKESVALDFATEPGARLLRGLIARADVVVENFRPGALERRGFGYEACRALNPGLIYASITGYGQTGPAAGRPGFDLVAQGEGGVMSLTGDADGPPRKVGVSQADIVTGLWTVGGILAALYARERTGHGQRVDTSLFGGQLSLLGFQGALRLAAGQEPARMGNRHPTLTPYETYATADGWMNVAVGTAGHWRALTVVLGRPALAEDARFADNAARIAHREELAAILVPLFRERPTADWLTALRAADIPAGAVRSVTEALESEEAAALGAIATLAHPTLGPLRQVVSPLDFSATPAAPRSAPPRLGADTDAVLREFFELSPEEIDRLRREGAIG